MSEEKQRREAGWPKLLREVDGLRVETCREVGNGFVRIPAGARGKIRTAGNGWHLLHFEGDPCDCCGVATRISRLSWRDLTPIGGDA